MASAARLNIVDPRGVIDERVIWKRTPTSKPSRNLGERQSCGDSKSIYSAIIMYT